MVRRNQQQRKELRKHVREASGQIGSVHGDYVPPTRDGCHHKQWEMAYDDANTVRVQFNLWRNAGRLVDFVVNLQVLTSEGWATVEYFDCCHGHSHHHTRNDEVLPRSIQRLDAVDDVQLGFAKVDGLVDERVRIIRDEGA